MAYLAVRELPPVHDGLAGRADLMVSKNCVKAISMLDTETAVVAELDELALVEKAGAAVLVVAGADVAAGDAPLTCTGGDMVAAGAGVTQEAGTGAACSTPVGDAGVA
jgi:hypothetical protein